MPKLPLRPTAVWQIAREVRAAAEDLHPIIVAGAAEAVERIGAALAEGGEERWVRRLPETMPAAYDLDGAGVLILAVAVAEPSSDEEEALRLAERKKVPVVCILLGVPEEAIPDVPHVLATDVVAVGPGHEVPVEPVLDHVAAQLEDKAYALAGRLPALRKPLCEHIVSSFSRQNGILGVAIFVPGADFPVLTLNQIRMVLRIAGAYGVELNRESAVEIIGVVVAGLGFRTIARQALAVIPFGGWALKGGVAYAGTRAIGEAAIQYFDAGGRDLLTGSVRSRS